LCERFASKVLTMKILLTQDVDNLGHAGDVKTVADGYGRNFLLPRGLATLATVGALKRADRVRTAAVSRRAKEKDDIDATAQVINGMTIHFIARAGEKGKLFGSITSAQIAAEISKKLGRELDKRKVALREPLRDTGSHAVTVRLSAESTPQVTVVVSTEGAPSATTAVVAPAAPAEAPAEPVAEA